MGKYIDKGNDGFASIRNSNFVDKSRLIAQVNSVLMTDNRFLCVTRARRFGKSVAVKMLNAYYDRSCHSRELFSGLQICGDKDFGKHLNHYPVLYLDMTDFVTKYSGDPMLLDKMKRDISDELLSLYEGITSKPDDDLMDILVNIVDRTGEKFICLIDEWDALCREGQTALMDQYVDFLRRLFKGSKTEYVFACAYLTGILPIKRYNTQSALNNFEEYTMLSPAQLAPYFGFTESEVESLCISTGVDAKEMKRWYDGYEIGGEKAIYNPYAVMRALKRRSFESYWASTNTFESLRQYITMNFDGLKDDVVSLLSDVPVKVNSLRFSNDMHRIECKDDVLTLLCHLGYLSYNSLTKCASIPNYEVRQEFEAAVADTGWAEVMLVGINYDKKTKKHECGIERWEKGMSSHPQTTHKLSRTTHKPLTSQQTAVMHLLANGEKGILELMEAAGYKDKRSFRLSVLNSLIANGLVTMTHPENSNHRGQRYRLTDTGRKEIE